MRLDDRIARLQMHAEQLLIHYRTLPHNSPQARQTREKLRLMFLRLLNLRQLQREIAADSLSPALIAAAAAANPVVQSTA
jgi:hypothetical protein